MAWVAGLGRAFRSIGQAVESAGRNLQGLKQSRETVSNHQTIMPLLAKKPQLSENIFVAPNAAVVGDVKMGPQSSVWYGAVVRGDVNSVSIGQKTNVQDNVTIHVARHSISGTPAATVVGNNCTIGHNAVLHACTVEDGCLVGMGSTLLDGVKVGKGSIVGAGAVVPPGTSIPAGEIWVGAPAKFLRKTTAEETAFVAASAENYAELAAMHAEENGKTFEEIELDKYRRADRLERDPDYDSHLGIERDPLTRQIKAVAQST